MLFSGRQSSLRRRLELSTRNKALSIFLGILIVAVIGAIVCVATSPPTGEQFTEFDVLGLGGKAEDYPRNLAIGDEGKVLLEIVNHEYQEMHYRVELKIEEMQNEKVNVVVLKHGERWKQEVSFTPQHAGENQRVDIYLFKQREDNPYRSLYLLVDVRERY